MEFNSQICTTKEQSKRLLDIGIKRDTADMYHYKWSEGYWDIQACPVRGSGPCYIPAWSLHRLMLLLNETIAVTNIEDAYETYIKCIAAQVRFGLLNKEYLNNDTNEKN